jgi:hypothetical protein
LNASVTVGVTVGEAELSVAATLGFGVVCLGVGCVVAGRWTSVFFCESAEDLLVSEVVVVRGLTVGEVLVFCAKALAADSAKTKTIPGRVLLSIGYSS